MSDTTFPPITDVLPHRGTMLLQDAVLSYAPDSTTCSFKVQADGWYIDATPGMPAWMGIEIMAQAVAAHVAMTAMQRGKGPKPGALLGSRDFRSTLPSFPAGSELRTTAILDFIDESGLGAYTCSIAIDGQEIAAAKLKVYEPEDFDQFLATGTQSQ